MPNPKPETRSPLGDVKLHGLRAFVASLSARGYMRYGHSSSSGSAKFPTTYISPPHHLKASRCADLSLAASVRPGTGPDHLTQPPTRFLMLWVRACLQNRRPLGLLNDDTRRPLTNSRWALSVDKNWLRSNVLMRT